VFDENESGEQEGMDIPEEVLKYFQGPPRDAFGDSNDTIMEFCCRCEGIFYIRPKHVHLYSDPDDVLCPSCDRKVIEDLADSYDPSQDC
jgi:hypothetical protein